MSYAEKMKEATFIGLRDVVYVPAYEAECIGAEADAALAAKNAEVAKLREELAEARKVIEDLLPSANQYEVPLGTIAQARAFLARKEAK